MKLSPVLACLTCLMICACSSGVPSTPLLGENAAASSPAVVLAATGEASQQAATSPTSSRLGESSPSPRVEWPALPVVPTLSSSAMDIYERGLAQGNDPHTFSRIGDGEIATTWFLPASCEYGPYSHLAETYAFFEGSCSRTGVAARAGFSTSRLLNPAYADPTLCEEGESPLACELRLNRPSFALISLGANQVWEPQVFAAELEIILQILIEHGVLPVLSTKGDNLEGDGCINAIIADLTRQYELPLWNFWAAIQDLPGHGLQPDGEHLTWAPCDFGDEEAMSHAWPVRNLTALQVLQAFHETASMFFPDLDGR